MTRKFQMLRDFDSLAAAELNDLAETGKNMAARSVSMQPAHHASQRRPASRAWAWLLGGAVLGLAILAGRR